MRRNVALVLSPLVAAAGMVGTASSADAVVDTTGAAIAVTHDHDFVEAAGYTGAVKIEVFRPNATTAHAVANGTGSPFEANHEGPDGCWAGQAPYVLPGDTIKVTASNGIDTMVVADVRLVGRPHEGQNGTVEFDITSPIKPEVMFRRDDPRFVAKDIPVTGTAPNWTATYDPPTAEARRIALTDSWWGATADPTGEETETTSSEWPAAEGDAPGCNGEPGPDPDPEPEPDPDPGPQAGEITLNRTALSFGRLRPSGSSTRTVNVRNDGSRPLGISQVAVAGKGFTLANNRCPASLDAADTCSIAVKFTARRPFGVRSGELTVVSTDPDERTSKVALSATVVKRR